MAEHVIPTVISQVKHEFFSPGRDVYQVRQDSKTDPFSFAIAVSSRSDFKGVDNSQAGLFSLRYKIQGGEDDGKIFNINMKRCLNDDWEYFHLDQSLSSREAELMREHMINDAFFCPEAFDLSFWGMNGDLDSKTITLKFEYSSA